MGKGAQCMIEIGDQIAHRFQPHVQADDLPFRIERPERACRVRQLDQAFIAAPACAHGEQLQLVEKGIKHLRCRRRQFE